MPRECSFKLVPNATGNLHCIVSQYNALQHNTEQCIALYHKFKTYYITIYSKALRNNTVQRIVAVYTSTLQHRTVQCMAVPCIHHNTIQISWYIRHAFSDGLVFIIDLGGTILTLSLLGRGLYRPLCVHYKVTEMWISDKGMDKSYAGTITQLNIFWPPSLFDYYTGKDTDINFFIKLNCHWYKLKNVTFLTLLVPVPIIYKNNSIHICNRHGFCNYPLTF